MKNNMTFTEKYVVLLFVSVILCFVAWYKNKDKSPETKCSTKSEYHFDWEDENTIVIETCEGVIDTIDISGTCLKEYLIKDNL